MKRLHIVFTGSGSGGHVFPLIAVAQELKKQAEAFNLPLDMRYFGSERAYAQDIVDADMDFVPILSSKMRRYASLMNIVDAVKFCLSIPQLLWKLFWFMPDAVFSKGGPGALAVVLVSRFYRIPVVIHESDSVPGLTNAISGKFADKVFLAFAPAADYFPHADVEISGNPVRQSLLDQKASLGGTEDAIRTNARKGFGLDVSAPTLFVVGGSQGAGKLNDFVLENLDMLLNDVQVIHQVGTRNFAGYEKEYAFASKDWSDREKGRYIPKAFFGSDLADAYAAADLIIARAGSGTLFEIAAFGKPSIIVPLENSANSHQKKNARLYEEAGAGIIVTEENLLGSIVADRMKSILGDPARFAAMSQAAQSFFRPDAATVIAKHLLTYVR
ncbi:MAG: UDP-N-acetylglucosamine--N-acetylmuramyl-(pentapeptide) pyrophosphoryl-undecaprenol N-acetylglucosamine transferase [Patescibacteria group bacterium]|nr:UDP-N-acetylglucosamine--N-acetylmuramyl-(pentapeptide) pyrophosphoryl-undecaprenol N-acetylglucosamine transferase [Patescibacteria group bacterium]